MKLDHFNRGLVPPASEPQTRTRQLVLVQAKDEEGFFCNIYEAISVRDGILFAERCRKASPGEVIRVVRGSSRELVRQWG